MSDICKRPTVTESTHPLFFIQTQGKKLEEKSFACLKILVGEEKALQNGIEGGERVEEKI